jgi:outer membrane protein OmpU
MKKLLLGTAAIGLALAATPAHAQVELELGGFFKGYGSYVDQDNDQASTPLNSGDARKFDILRHTEVHFGGETTLDNGLTVGIHIEAEADGNNADGFEVEESYAYFAGSWGRVNLGAEDGAQYLLQVEAPSADSNVDGLRQFIQPVNYVTATDGNNLVTNALSTAVTANGIDYETNATGYDDKFTYLSPIMSGFQVGVSYTPDVADAATDLSGNAFDDVNDAQGDAYEAGIRYEGEVSGVGVTAGAGYTQISAENTTVGNPGGGAISDDQTVWNAGLDLDIGAFGIGVSYSEDDFGGLERGVNRTQGDEETLVVGVDYTTGPFKLGASYLTQDGTLGVAGNTGTDGIETERYTGGVVYTYGPGMTFRGSISHVEHDNVAGLTGNNDSIDATSVLLGTQINF